MARIRRALAPLAVSGLIALGAAGCAGSHLHRQQDDDLAKQALEAFDSADISASVDDEYTLLDELLAQELAIVRRHTLARRDADLVAIVSADGAAASWQFFERRISARETTLVGSDPTRVAELRQALLLLPVHERNLASHKADYDLIRQAGDPAAVCPAKRPIDEDKVSRVGLPSLKQHQKTCQLVQTALATIQRYTAAGTLFGDINRELAAIGEFESAIAAQVAELQAGYRALDKEIAAAKAERKKTNAIDVTAKLEAARKKMLAAIAPYEQRLAQALPIIERLDLQDLAISRQLVEITAQRQAVDDLLGFLISGQGEPPEFISPVIALRLEIARAVPAIGLELVSARQYPRVGALLLESEHLRLAVRGLEARLKRAKERAALLRQKRDAMAEELFYLGQARAALAQTPAASRNQALMDSYRQSPRIRRDVADALLSYANAWTFGRAAQEEADYRLIDLSHRSALDASQNALAQWENLIRVPLGQLVALHGSGITSEDIVGVVEHLITAAGFAAVAFGVNQ